MASAAVLGASGGLAFAQTSQVPANPSQGQLAAPYAGGASYNSNNNAWGIANTPSGSAAAGGLSSYGAMGPNFYAVPAPGTVVIRFNGKVEADVGAGFTSLDNVAASFTNPATISTAGVITPGSTITGRVKTNPIAVGSYVRLYPGFDGMSANGIRYGAQIELRENFQSAQTTSGTPAAPSLASPSVNSSAETIYVRRAYTYLASDQVGLVRLGQGDGVVGLFDNCIFTAQCWDAGAGVFQNNAYGAFFPTSATGGGSTNFPWLAQSGAEYGNSKIVYLTPQFYGFDFGVQYAPNQGNSFQNSSPLASFPATVGSPASPAVGGDLLISITSGATSNRWYNQAGAGGRFERVFGAVDVKAYGYYEHAAGEDNTVGGYTASLPGSAGFRTASANALHYDPMSFYQAGLAVTSYGLTASVAYIGGRVNNQLALVPRGGAPTSATVLGLTYVNGPWVAGFATGIIDTQGNANLTDISQRHQFETSAGSNYKLAPGVQLYRYHVLSDTPGWFQLRTQLSRRCHGPCLQRREGPGSRLHDGVDLVIHTRSRRRRRRATTRRRPIYVPLRRAAHGAVRHRALWANRTIPDRINDCRQTYLGLKTDHL